MPTDLRSAHADSGAAVAAPGRYDRIAILLHWVIGLALLGQIGFGLLLDEIAPRNNPARASVINLHKSIGLVLGAAIVLRVLWRLGHRPPAWPPGLPAWQRTAANLGHGALYACMLVMPLSGYIASNFSKWGVKFFGLALPPWGPESKPLYDFFNVIHVTTGWIFAALIAGHVAIALHHAVIARDGVFARIWPWAAR